MTKISLGVIVRKFVIFSSSVNPLIPFLSCLAMSATAANADVLMKCGETLYKYEYSFFGDDQIKVRWDGVWQTWCGDGRLELTDYSATCWPLEGAIDKVAQSGLNSETSTESFLTYAYGYCKCGPDESNYDCFAKHGISKYAVALGNIEFSLDMVQPNHSVIQNDFCPAAENLSLADVRKLFSQDETLVRAMFRMNSSNPILEVGSNKIDFVAHLLRFDTLTTECEVMDQ